ncbi:CRISPR system precrRNA processing endoribonuclease RAMP protein Cas6 [uncultured Desulfuromonas sp.]|uniref:CRISPR system precrRNA processing endoribonuclease RAMP protein Cas6 n=1 Tax=uncultured Desulfuromonas sp. TaxID=181013 RepID=UPI002AAC4593|nr:CRISPR system precrRNA processing endoribonuclease RAMP protein Cas6 [uncultured Desulfuromonas sp.]
MILTGTLERAEFVKLRYRVRLLEPLDVDLATLLRLRRNLRAAGSYVFYHADGRTNAGVHPFSQLFSPPIADDPVARQRYQQSAAAFVLQPDPACCRHYQRDELLTFPVVLWGGRQEQIVQLAQVFQALGKNGLRHDAGRFELLEIAGQDSSGRYANLWRAGEDLAQVQSPLRDADWWLSTLPVAVNDLTLKFITPARLMQRNRPLFRADFSDLFPFILRRVTSMLYAHCHLELVDDPARMIELAQQVVVLENHLEWQDWRQLGPDPQMQQPLGGLMGTLRLQGATLVDLLPVLELGTLMNLGKNAAYGAGCYHLQVRGEPFEKSH